MYPKNERWVTSHGVEWSRARILAKRLKSWNVHCDYRMRKLITILAGLNRYLVFSKATTTATRANEAGTLATGSGTILAVEEVVEGVAKLGECGQQ